VLGRYGVVVRQHIAEAGVGIDTGVPAGQAEREVAVLLARPGPRVRAWGEWCVIVSVRREQCGVGDPDVVLGLDEGQDLCVQAAEQPVVRQREDVSAAIPLVIDP
jgi:hypothetical protein